MANLTSETELSQAWVLDITSTDLTAAATIPGSSDGFPLGEPAS